MQSLQPDTGETWMVPARANAESAPLPRLSQLRMARLLEEIAQEITPGIALRPVLTDLAETIRNDFVQECRQGMAQPDY